MFGLRRHKAKQFRYGKAPAVKDDRTLRLKKYLKPGLPSPPKEYSSLDRLAKRIGTGDVTKLFPMDGNDQYGDCVMAAKAHLKTNYAGLVGRKEIMSSRDVVRLYLQLTGGVDEGLNMMRVLKYWKNTGIAGHKIEAFVGLDERDESDIKNAIMLFGGVDLGFKVQDACIADFQAHRIWKPGPSDGGGHDVVAVGWRIHAIYGEVLEILTWGGLALASMDWWHAQVDESYTALAPEARVSGFAQNIDYPALQSDLVLIAG